MSFERIDVTGSHAESWMISEDSGIRRIESGADSFYRSVKAISFCTYRRTLRGIRYCKSDVTAYRNTRLVVDALERVDLGKMNLQLIANEENQDRAQCGKNEAGGMISFVSRARKHVGNAAADDRSYDAEHDRPEDRHMRVHHRFRDKPRD